MPASGFVGQGVFAWTSYKYTNWWNWYADPYGGTHDYTWYVQKPGNITKLWDRVDHSGFQGTGIISANNHRWGAQNHVDAPRRWAVFWGVA